MKIPFFEQDYEGWKLLNQKIGDKIRIIGDDLFVTNPTKLKQGIDQKISKFNSNKNESNRNVN